MSSYPYTPGFGVGLCRPTPYTPRIYTHEELEEMVTDAEKACISARQQLESALKALKVYEQTAATTWNPRSPVPLVPGDQVLVRGCFGSQELCSKWVKIHEGTVANRLEHSASAPDKFDDQFAEEGLTKVEWYSKSEDGTWEYIKCWVYADQIDRNQK